MKQIFEKLSNLGVPVHALGNRSKVPIDKDWQKNPFLIPTCDDNCNIGVRCGATIGMKNHDLYVHIVDMDQPTKTAITNIKSVLNDRVFIEKSGGQHRGLHFCFTSHLPLPYAAKSLKFPELYGLDQNYHFRNVAIAPSKVEVDYTIFDPKTKIWSTSEDIIIESWKYIISHPIAEESWLKIMRLIVPQADLKEKVFIFMFVPLITSEDFNYKFFGQILSATALRLGFPIPKLMSWTEKLLKTLPDGLRDDKTIKQILKYQEDTPSRKTPEDSIPGFPTIDKILTEEIPISRGYIL